MAVAVDTIMAGGNQTDTQSADNATSSTSTPITVGGSATLLVVIVGWQAASADPSSRTATWNGTSMTEAVTINHGSTPYCRSSIFTLVSPASGAKSLVVSWTSTADAYIWAISFTGTDTTTGYNAANNATATNTGTVTVTGTTDGATVAGFIGDGSEPAVTYTIIGGYAALDPGGASDYRLGGTSDAHAFTGTTPPRRALVGINVIAGAAVGHPTTKRFGGTEFFAGRGPAQRGMRQW